MRQVLILHVKDLGGLSMVASFELDAFIPPIQREKVDKESFVK